MAMDTIGDYVRRSSEPDESDIQKKISQLRFKAVKHETESSRLARLGDHHKAAYHAGIARMNNRAAQSLEQESADAAH